MATRQTVSVLWFRGLLHAAEKLGMDSTTLLKAATVTEDVLASPYARLSLEQNLKLWRAIEQHNPETNVGLAIGQYVKPSNFQLLALTLMQSPSLGEALNKSMRYTRLLSDGGKYSVATEGDQVALCYQPQAAGFSYHQVDAVLLLLHKFSSWLACRDIPLDYVELTHEASTPAEYEAAFSAPVKFSAKRNALVFHKKILDEPLALTDSYLAQMHEQLLESQLALISEQDTATLVRHLLRSSAELTISREEIAQQLHMSSRSLQRKLKECDTSFQVLLDEERFLRAKQLLQQLNLSLTDISAQLGFSESSVFTRAFKRWSGVPPQEYRLQHYG